MNPNDNLKCYESEIYVLLSMICGGSQSRIFKMGLNLLNEDCFYDEKNKTIFKSILQLARNGVSDISLTSISIFGKIDLSFLKDTYHTGMDFESKVEKLIVLSEKRKAVSFINEAINEIKADPNADPFLVLQQKCSLLSYSHKANRRDYIMIEEAAKEAFRLMCDVNLKEKMIKTGYPLLDEYLGGLNDGHLIILAGRPSTGKTALALNFVENVVKSGKRVAFFSLEMTAVELARRLLSSMSGVGSDKMLKGEVSDDEKEIIKECVRKTEALEIGILDTTSLQLVKEKCALLANTYKVNLIVIDYLQLIKAVGSTNKTAEVSEISRTLKEMAMQLRIPILCLSQLSRKSEARATKKPELSDLRDSGSIEQDADSVILLHKNPIESQYIDANGDPVDANGKAIEDTSYELLIAKNRHGAVGSVGLKFNKSLIRFESINN